MGNKVCDIFAMCGECAFEGLDGAVVSNLNCDSCAGDDSNVPVVNAVITNVLSSNSLNGLAAIKYEFEKRFNSKLCYQFVDINDDNLCEALPVISEVMVNEIIKRNLDLYSLVIGSVFECKNNSIVIECDEAVLMLASDETLSDYKKQIKDYLYEITKARNIADIIVISSSITSTPYRIYGSERKDMIDKKPMSISEDDSSTAVDSKAVTREKSKKSVSSEEKEPLDKNSWEYKAQEQMKLNKTENSGYKYRASNAEDTIFGRVHKGVTTVKCVDFEVGEREVNVEGYLTLRDELKLSKSGKCVIANFFIMDKTGAISGFAFIKPEEAGKFEEKFAKGGYAGFQGEPTYNRGEIGLKVSGAFPVDKPKGRKDLADVRRVELHAHTKMSEKDAVANPSDLAKTAARFGHSACAVTDHGVVQAFPEFYDTGLKLKVGDSDKPFKTILGMEGYLVDDGPTICYNIPIEKEDTRAIGSICSIAISTTGSDSCDDAITKIAAKRYRLKGYKEPFVVPEGESDESAREFSSKDIDEDLLKKFKESLGDKYERYEAGCLDDNSDDEAVRKRKEYEDSISKLEKEAEDSVVTLPFKASFSENGKEVVPKEIEFIEDGTFFATFSGEVYTGGKLPKDSYFKIGKLSEFIGDSYICGPDVFSTLDFIRKAGYGIDIEQHRFYRHKFLQPAIDCDEIVDLANHRSDDDSVEDGNDDESSDSAKDDSGDLCVIPEVSEDENELMRVAQNYALFLTDYLKEKGTVNPNAINEKVGHLVRAKLVERKRATYHIILLARNNLGLYNMYRLISASHVNYFSFRPRIPKSLLRYFKSSIIVGSACERGELYRAALKSYKENDKSVDAAKEALLSDREFNRMMRIYDYVEIQPICNNMFMTRTVESKSDMQVEVALTTQDIVNMNILVSNIGDSLNKPVCATTDAHFIEKEDGRFRKYMLMEMGFADAEQQADLYFRTTDEMLNEFTYLGEDKAYEVVVTNTNNIADKIEYGIKPFPSGTYPPMIATAASDVQNITWTKAMRMYCHDGVIDETVRLRLNKELKSIIGHGFAIMYYIAYRLVKKSNNDGYIVGSRGSVGSSLVATMCGISEVNPLPAHYRCPKCAYTEYAPDGIWGSGFDMPEKDCPCCEEKIPMVRDGQNIPFETFLGFNGDKQPDIDLNFSSEYQPRAHKYVELLFGKTHTFRAGTIGTYADKNAAAIARKIGEEKGVTITPAQSLFMTDGIVGVKRTTSQHPGGIVVVPKEMEVYEFTPVQYPANKTDCGIITTHFDFNAMHDTILKLDILGHADPTVLRMLNELTNIEVTTIPVPDEKVMSLLESTDALGFDISKTDAGSATLGLSELGTNMARGMIKETKPSKFYDLVQLMGLSHGTDVWAGNAQDLIRDNVCDLNSVIGCRDSIMTTLINYGLPNKASFDIMEKVRKGKGLSAEHEQLMHDNNVPQWYIDSCKKIKYMFPKAHAAAYSISTLRVAWFKVYYPEEYYCAFFTIRGDEFKAENMCQGVEHLKSHRIFLAEQMKIESSNPKIKSAFYLCEIVEEMYARGIVFAPISINDSQAVKFTKVEKGVIRPPLNVIDSISSGIAQQIVDARNEAPFINCDDFASRSGIGKSAMKKIRECGLLDGMAESAQVNIFDIMGGGI